jgi:RND family efflux transporter MFP subunit
VPARIETSGTVRAIRRATVAAKVAGTVERKPLTLGQPVRAGDVLLTISAPELEARVVQARAQLAQTQRELARERGLLSTGAGTGDAVKSLEDQLAQRQAALREAESMVGYTTVRAPFDGFLAREFVETGDYAASGAALLQLDGDAFEIEVGLPESLASPIQVGAELDVEIPSTAARLRATVSEIAASAESSARTTTVRLTLPANSPARAGQFARVFLSGSPAAMLLVPANAVSHFGQMERVFTVTPDNRATLRIVKTGARHGDDMEIVAGLEAGERVVTRPPATLRDGQPLEIAP